MEDLSFNMSIHSDLEDVIAELLDVANDKVVIEQLGGQINIIIMALKHIQHRTEIRENLDYTINTNQEKYEKSKPLNK